MAREWEPCLLEPSSCSDSLISSLARIPGKFLVAPLLLVAGSGAVLRSGNNFDLVLNTATLCTKPRDWYRLRR